MVDHSIVSDTQAPHHPERLDGRRAEVLPRRPSFFFALDTDNRINYGPVMENIVYSYARNCGYEVSVGRVDRLECNFICGSGAASYAYVQVALTIMNSRGAEDREYRPLEAIRDNYPKCAVTRSGLTQHRSVIIHVSAVAPRESFGLALALLCTYCNSLKGQGHTYFKSPKL